MKIATLGQVNSLSSRLREVGIDDDTAFLAAGRYLTGHGSAHDALNENYRDGGCSFVSLEKAINIIDGWVIRE